MVDLVSAPERTGGPLICRCVAPYAGAAFAATHKGVSLRRLALASRTVKGRSRAD
jgi:hypothetical protein